MRIERFPGHIRPDPAQHIVGAEFDDHGVGARRHRPIEPAEPVGGRIAGNAGIRDLHGNAFARERRLQPRHEAILLREAKTCRQRVAERHDLDRRLCSRSTERLPRR